MHELLILRHGQTLWNAEGRMQGTLNSALDATGHRQAARQRAILGGRDLTGFGAFCSPQGRAVETAGIAVAPLMPRITTDARLREIGVGAWEGKRRADFVTAEAADLSYYDGAPGGEGFAALRARCEAFLAELTGPAVIVTHGITSRMLRLVALGMETAELSALPGGQGNVHRIAGGDFEVLE